MRIRDMNDVQKVMQRYSSDKQEKITQRVKRYLKACAKMEAPLDPIVRVWQEAIEAQEIEEKFSFKDEDHWPRFEPIRSYQVYKSPIDMKL